MALQPAENVLFWLVPRSTSAFKCLADPHNAFLVDKVRHCGEKAFAISLEQASTAMPGSLQIFGRKGDIVIREDSSISSGLIFATH